MNITIRDLRRLLFHVENQEITVKTLRDILFTMPDQDAIAEDML